LHQFLLEFEKLHNIAKQGSSVLNPLSSLWYSSAGAQKWAKATLTSSTGGRRWSALTEIDPIGPWGSTMLNWSSWLICSCVIHETCEHPSTRT
jgi:hypothetical protein